MIYASESHFSSWGLKSSQESSNKLSRLVRVNAISRVINEVLIQKTFLTISPQKWFRLYEDQTTQNSISGLQHENRQGDSKGCSRQLEP
jgi:hypothetical protein